MGAFLSQRGMEATDESGSGVPPHPRTRCMLVAMHCAQPSKHMQPVGEYHGGPPMALSTRGTFCGGLSVISAVDEAEPGLASSSGPWESGGSCCSSSSEKKKVLLGAGRAQGPAGASSTVFSPEESAGSLGGAAGAPSDVAGVPLSMAGVPSGISRLGDEDVAWAVHMGGAGGGGGIPLRNTHQLRVWCVCVCVCVCV